jgi:hypothetical protein
MGADTISTIFTAEEVGSSADMGYRLQYLWEDLLRATKVKRGR